jgi:hypothetical protein
VGLVDPEPEGFRVRRCGERRVSGRASGGDMGPTGGFMSGTLVIYSAKWKSSQKITNLKFDKKLFFIKLKSDHLSFLSKFFIKNLMKNC